jgi:CheY-like chemotaxis protein/anti-sigma regulatory factor (Ser/Thr protein kinase)
MSNILVVDDSPVERKVAVALLSSQPDWNIMESDTAEEALLSIDLCPLDLLITDLQMPKVGGLELLGQVKSRQPLLPVLVMSARGSEELAVLALRHGADSYITKRQLQEDLVPAVDRVLTAVREGRKRVEVMQCIQSTSTEFELECDLARIAPVIKYLVDQCCQFGIANDREQVRLSVALEEALTNAIIHGNLEVSSKLREQADGSYERLIARRQRQRRYAGRRVRVGCHIDRYLARITVRDEGPGFDVTALPDPRDPEHLALASGRGVLLMRTFMDEVTYNDVGNEVILIKRRPPTPTRIPTCQSEYATCGAE